MAGGFASRPGGATRVHDAPGAERATSGPGKRTLTEQLGYSAPPPARAPASVEGAPGADRVQQQPAAPAAPLTLRAWAGKRMPEALPSAAQFKLAVGGAQDAAEQEADSIADALVAGGDVPTPTARPGGAAQAKTADQGWDVGPGAEERIGQARGGGAQLPAGMRGDFESRLGADLGRVRVHTDDEAGRTSQAVHARAFTVGQDIFFGPGQYAPDTTEGKRLLAHEVVHTVQQSDGAAAPIRRVIGEGVFRSPRFFGEAFFVSIVNDGAELAEGMTGSHVRKLQQALVDAGIAPDLSVDGSFGPTTTDAVKQLQNQSGLEQTGRFGQPELDKLDGKFESFAPYIDAARGKAPAALPTEGTEYPLGAAPDELLAGTRALNVEEKEAADRVLAPVSDVHGEAGELPAFDNEDGKYEEELSVLVETDVIDQIEDAERMKTDREKPDNLHDWADVEAVANRAKLAVDTVFGKYATGPAFDHVSNLRDMWEVKEAMIAVMGEGDKAARAQWRVTKAMQESSEVRKLNKERNVVRSRSPEKEIIEKVVGELAVTYKEDMLLVDKSWPGANNPDTHEVMLQRIKSEDADGNKDFMWDAFQTIIHEYIHSLTHSKYRSYFLDLDDDEKTHALKEGVTEFLTKVVWSSLALSDELRAQVEGPYHEEGVTFDVPEPNYYDEVSEAEQLVGVVGVNNLYAAYFLGRVDLIGGELV